MSFCVYCGEPAVGRFQFFYENAEAKDPKWSSPEFCCEKHKAYHEEAGHAARVAT